MTVAYPLLLAKWPNLAGVPLGHDLGWSAVLDKMMTAMVNAGFDITRDKVVRAKEKFGCLSLEVDIDQSLSGDDLRRTSINEAIRLSNNSARVCEVCGEAGHQLVSGSCRMARCESMRPKAPRPYVSTTRAPQWLSQKTPFREVWPLTFLMKRTISC